MLLDLRGALEDEGEGYASVGLLLDSTRLWGAEGNDLVDAHGAHHSRLRANEEDGDTGMEAVLGFVNAAGEAAHGLPQILGGTHAGVEFFGDPGDVKMEGVQFQPDVLELCDLQALLLQFRRVIGKAIPCLEQLHMPVGQNVTFLLGEGLRRLILEDLLDRGSE